MVACVCACVHICIYVQARRKQVKSGEATTAHWNAIPLSKAFDTVPHLSLLHKLSCLQIPPFLLRCMDMWLFVVLVPGSGPGWHHIKHTFCCVWCPTRVSILGPLLFLIYIDQVASCVTYSNITMYADDIAMYKIISNPSDYTYLQEDILSLCSWIANNYLTLNSQKCRYMIFTRKHQPKFPTSDLYVNDHHACTCQNWSL